MIWQNFKMALISLRGAKLRSFLTMLGIIIGIAAVVAINAIGAGVKQQVAGQISGLGSNVITVTSGKTISTDKNGKTSLNPGASFGVTTLTAADLDSVSRTDHIAAAAPIMVISGIAAYGGSTAGNSLIAATTPSLNQIRNGKLESGRFLEDQDRTAQVVVLGASSKTDLFGQTPALGQTITIRGLPFAVIGVLQSTDTGASSLSGGGFDSIIYLPIDSASTITGGNLQILRILAQADSPDSVKPAVGRLKQTIMANHGGQEDFSVLTQADLISTVGNILDLLATFIAAIASIALIVGGIGIMNIMLVSVTERTREIGIRKALGATRSTIAVQFLIEAVVISLIGGLLGIAAAIGLAKGAGKLAKIAPAFSLGTFVLAISVAVGIGIVFGLAPAIKAARKKPIEALRYE